MYLLHMRHVPFRFLVVLALAAVVAAPASAVRREPPRVRPKAAISPVHWALRAVNYVETRAGDVLGRAATDCVKAAATQDWARVEAENRTLRDYLLAAEPARRSLVVQSNAAARLLRRYAHGGQRQHLERARSLLLAAAAEHATSFEALRDGANALDRHDCVGAHSDSFTSGQQSVAGQDEARRGLIELRAAGFGDVDPDWAYE